MNEEWRTNAVCWKYIEICCFQDKLPNLSLNRLSLRTPVSFPALLLVYTHVLPSLWRCFWSLKACSSSLPHTGYTDAIVLWFILHVYVLSTWILICWATALYPLVYLEFLICFVVVLRAVMYFKTSQHWAGDFAHRMYSVNDWWFIKFICDMHGYCPVV